MTNGSCPRCPKCKSWEESSPLNWIIVATVAGVVTAVATAALQKWWGLNSIVLVEKPVSAQVSQGKYQSTTR